MAGRLVESMCRPRKRAFRALREDLERVLPRLKHHIPDTVDKREWHCFVEQVAHRIHEHESRTPPSQRLLQAMLMHEHILRGVRISPRLSRIAEPKADRLGVAM